MYLRPRRQGSITITVDYSYDVHSISVSDAEWKRISVGRVCRLTGHGFNIEETRDVDRWQFNRTTSGSIEVSTDGGYEIYSGLITDGKVWVRDVDHSCIEVLLPDLGTF